MEKNKSLEFLLCVTIVLLALNLIASLWPATPVGAEEKPPEKQIAAVLVSSSNHDYGAGGQSITEYATGFTGFYADGSCVSIRPEDLRDGSWKE